MDWPTALLTLLGLALGFALGRGTAPRPPRIAFYPRYQTGVDVRRRLFGE